MWSLFWLLLPIAAASGWYLAKREYQKQSNIEPHELPREYYNGLNYILNEQSDKAIDLFLKLSEIDPGAVEIQLALGSLFRRRGEVDRAISLHQGLINNSGANNHVYMQSLHELALDYMSAGLLDRAESVCLELIDINAHDLAVLHILREIYQQEKEWFRAIEMARKIMLYSAENQSHVIAHYYCELACNARKNGDLTQATRMLERALIEDGACGRAMIMLGNIDYGLGRYPEAIAHYKKLEKFAPEYLSEILSSLQACYEALEKPAEMITHLEELVHKNHAVDLVLAVAVIIRKHTDEATTLSFLMREVGNNPSLRGVQSLLDMEIKNYESNGSLHIKLIKESLDKLLTNKPVYRCVRCGFTGMDMHWCCPGCKRWSSVKAIQEFQWGASI